MKWASLGVLLVLAILLLGGCKREATPTPSTTPTPPTASPSPVAPPLPVATPTPAPQPPTPEALPLSILEPQDEAVVREGLLRLAGRTAPDAVVSVNGRILRAIDEEGNFTTTLTLSEGPNLIEVIATDYQGNQVVRVLTIIYTP